MNSDHRSPQPDTDPVAIVDAVDLSTFLGHDPLRSVPSGEGLDALPSAPLLALAALLRDQHFLSAFPRVLFAVDPDFRSLLPREPHSVLERFIRAMTHVLVTAEESAGDQSLVQPVIAFAEHLGADHAKLGLTDAHFVSFGTALSTTLAHLAGPKWSEALASTLNTAYSVVSDAMLRGIASVPEPSRFGATVAEVVRPCRDVAIVRLVTDSMIDYLPGQYLSVQTPYAPTQWRKLSPAVPANPALQLEFHVRSVPGGDVSGAIVLGASPGDRWVLSRPFGQLDIEREAPQRDVLMIACGTGIAPLRALLIDMLRFPDNPRVHLFYGARYPGELYALPMLVDLASSAPWLTIQPVAEHPEDPWWMQGESITLPRTLHRLEIGRPVDVVTKYGAWADRQVLVSGSPDMIRGTVRGLVATGTPREAISFDPI